MVSQNKVSSHYWNPGIIIYPTSGLLYIITTLFRHFKKGLVLKPYPKIEKAVTTFAHKVLQFYKQLSYPEKLPHDIRIMNPFEGNPEILSIAALFYNKFYHDHHQRKLILGINPGRLGAGATGIPFTDTKRLQEICDIKPNSCIRFK